MVSCRFALAMGVVLGAVGTIGGEGHGGCETLTCDAGAQEFCTIVEHQPSRASHAAISTKAPEQAPGDNAPPPAAALALLTVCGRAHRWFGTA